MNGKINLGKFTFGPAPIQDINLEKIQATTAIVAWKTEEANCAENFEIVINEQNYKIAGDHNFDVLHELSSCQKQKVKISPIYNNLTGNAVVKE